MPDCTTARRAAMMAAVLTLIILSVAVLACGPATPAGQAGTDADSDSATPTLRWLNTPPSPSELATLEAMPTHTPYPPGYIKPTDPPALTDDEVKATRTAYLTGHNEQQGQRGSAVSGAAETATNTPVPTQVPLTEQVTEFVREERYDAIAHVSVDDSRTVTVPTDIEWPRYQETFPSLTRTLITTITTYYGTLPMGYELITPSEIPWLALETGQEYVLFITKTYAGESECSQGKAPGQRCLNTIQLDAVGGPGGLRMGKQSWIVDGSRAWRIPYTVELPPPDGFRLSAQARSGTESLLLTELEAAIRAGLQ